jgi:hypothetical protein
LCALVGIGMAERTGNVGGALSVVLSIFGGGALAFYIALQTFWWCPQGGCSLRSLDALGHLLGNLVGLTVIFLGSAILLWYASVPILARPWYPRAIAERTYLSSTIRLPDWYRNSMCAWIRWLWGVRRVRT